MIGRLGLVLVGVGVHLLDGRARAIVRVLLVLGTPEVAAAARTPDH